MSDKEQTPVNASSPKDQTPAGQQDGETFESLTNVGANIARSQTVGDGGAGKEEGKEPEVSYESLLITLKDQNSKMKKQQTIQTKLEEKYRAQRKTIKIYETFIKYVFPASCYGQIMDQEGKFKNLDADQMKKILAESKVQAQQEPMQEVEYVSILKEENETLKNKISEMLQLQKMSQNAGNGTEKKVKEQQQRINQQMTLISEKDKELTKLRKIEAEFNELKGVQLLQMIKAGNNGAQKAPGDNEEIQQLKKMLSEKTNRILEMNDKLQLANETIQTMETQHELHLENYHNKNLEESKSEIDESNDFNQMANIDEEGNDEEELQFLRQKVTEMEQIRNELLEKIEVNKEKARAFLMKKDLERDRLKMVIAKIEMSLKQHHGLAQEDINKMVNLKEEEVQKMLQMEKEVDQNEGYETFRYQEQPPKPQESGILQTFDKQLNKNKHNGNTPHSEIMGVNTEYLRNVFVSYLQYLAQNNSKEIRTIEHVLFTELKVTHEQKQRIDHLRRQNTFWKKFLLMTSQPTVKGKFSAAVFKQKLFGNQRDQRPSNIMNQYQLHTTRQSVGGHFPNDLMNRSITSPYGTHNTTLCQELENDKQNSSLYNTIHVEHPGIARMGSYQGAASSNLDIDNKIAGQSDQ